MSAETTTPVLAINLGTKKVVIPTGAELQAIMSKKSGLRTPDETKIYKQVEFDNWAARGAYTTAQLAAGRSYEDLTADELFAAETHKFTHDHAPRNIFGMGHSKPAAIKAGIGKTPDILTVLANLDLASLEAALAAKKAAAIVPVAIVAADAVSPESAEAAA